MKIFISWNGEPDKTVNYANSVKKEGLEPIFDFSKINECCGIIMMGGADIDPKLYRQENKGSLGVNKKRDEFEFEVLGYAVKNDIPTLGICRGHQLINVYFGGTLFQDIPNHKTENNIRKFHKAKAMTDTFKRIYGEEFIINSFHHQSIDKMADDFVPTLISSDGVNEGMIHKTRKIISVQWHPEKEGDQGVDGQIFLKKFYQYCVNKNNDLFDV